MQYIFVNNSLESFTADRSGAIATHIASVRAAAQRAGTEPLVLTIRREGDTALDAAPTHCLRPVPQLSGFLLRVVRKACRLLGWQGLEQPWYAVQVRRALRRIPAGSEGRVLVLHNDPDVADFLARRFRDDVVVHVWHNVLPFGRSRGRDVRHVAVSAYLASAVSAAAGTLPEVVPNGVDAETFHPGGTSHECLTVSFLGRTGIEKGPDLLLRALLDLPPDVPPPRLLLIGSNTWGALMPDDYQELLTDLVGRLDSRGVVVQRTGHLDRVKVAEVLRESDVHVVPSRWEDPAPLVLMEAMATGLCVIAARSGGMPEYGADSVLWFERDDVAGLTGQLVRALEQAPLRDRLRRRARARAEELTWQRTWQALQKVAEA